MLLVHMRMFDVKFFISENYLLTLELIEPLPATIDSVALSWWRSQVLYAPFASCLAIVVVRSVFRKRHVNTGCSIKY